MFNRICDWVTNMMVLWLLFVCGIGYFFPPAITWLKPYLEYLFMFTMLGIGLVMKAEDFIPVIKNPGSVLLGTLSQFVIMSFLGWSVGLLLALPKDLAVGLILTGAAPGAMASNVISYIAKADTAYSIALTTVSTFLAPVLTPAFTLLYAKQILKVEFLPMLLSIVKMVLVPLGLGLLLRKFLKDKLDAVKGIFPAFSTVFIAFICGLVLALNRDYVAKMTPMVFVAVFIVNAAGLYLGYLSGVLYRFDEKRRRTLAFEVGMQNAGLGAVLALKHISAQAAIPNALFAIWCIITASILANWWATRGLPAKKPQQ